MAGAATGRGAMFCSLQGQCNGPNKCLLHKWLRARESEFVCSNAKMGESVAMAEFVSRLPGFSPSHIYAKPNSIDDICRLHRAMVLEAECCYDGKE